MVFLMINLICLQDSLSDLGINELLYFKITLVNSSSENGFHCVIGLLGISSSNSVLIWWFCAELNDKWRACHRSSNLRHSQPLYWMASMARSLHLFTQFIDSQGLEFLFEISWIFWSKKVCLIFLTVLLKLFQSSICFEILYFSSSL